MVFTRWFVVRWRVMVNRVLLVGLRVVLLGLVGVRGPVGLLAVVVRLRPRVLVAGVVLKGIVVFGFWFPSAKTFRLISMLMEVGVPKLIFVRMIHYFPLGALCNPRTVVVR